MEGRRHTCIRVYLKELAPKGMDEHDRMGPRREAKFKWWCMVYSGME